MKEKNKRLVLLDAHAILHRAYHALPDFSTSKGEPTGGLYGVSTMLIKIIGEFKPDYIIACYDLPKPTYRHEAYAGYKAGRKKADDELVAQMKRSRDLLTALGVQIYDKEGFEADDILGTIVEKTKNDPDIEIIIASGDMDTLQLVCDKKVQVFTLRKGIQDTILYDEEAVQKRFGFGPDLLPDYKGLRGDPSDNIIGIKGIGEKTASDLIQKFGRIEEIYKVLKKDKKLFEKAGIKERIIKLLEEGEEEALFSKTLATIRRDAPIDFSLPDKNFKDGLNIEKAGEIFNELEFRTLLSRLKTALGFGVTEKISFENSNENVVKKEEKMSDLEVKETLTSFWVLNSGITDPKIEDVLQFIKTDSLGLAKVKIAEELKRKNLFSVYEDIERPLIPVIEKMEKRGVYIDEKKLKKLSLEYHEKIVSLEEEIWKISGEKFNVSSPKQLSTILFQKLGLKIKNHKKTGGGALSTKESELEKMRDLSPIIPLILEHRELSKLLGTYIDTIPNVLDVNKRLHAKFLSAGTATGRMSSKDPNLQNIPNKTDLGRKIRTAFVAEKGFKLVAFDYSQIELRIAAFLSNDKKLIEIFKKGEDVHTGVAMEVFGVEEKDVTKDMRRQAKVINFGVMYGMGVNALQVNLGSNRADAQKFYNEYFNKFSGLATYLETVKSETAKRGYTETLFGRRRYFEGINSKIPYIRASAERMAINAPIQGTEADIIKIAMIKADQFIEKNNLSEKVYLLLQVHDELVYEIAEGEIEKVSKEIKIIMESIVSERDRKGVPIIAEVSVGDNWGEMKKITF